MISMKKFWLSTSADSQNLLGLLTRGDEVFLLSSLLFFILQLYKETDVFPFSPKFLTVFLTSRTLFEKAFIEEILPATSPSYRSFSLKSPHHSRQDGLSFQWCCQCLYSPRQVSIHFGVCRRGSSGQDLVSLTESLVCTLHEHELTGPQWSGFRCYPRCLSARGPPLKGEIPHIPQG